MEENNPLFKLAMDAQEEVIPRGPSLDFYKKWLSKELFPLSKALAVSLGINLDDRKDFSGFIELSPFEKEKIEFVIDDLDAKKKLYITTPLTQMIGDTKVSASPIKYDLESTNWGLDNVFVCPIDIIESTYQCDTNFSFIRWAAYNEITGKKLKYCQATSPIYEFYEKWSKYDLWSIEQSVCLIMGIDPLFYQEREAYIGEWEETASYLFSKNDWAFNATLDLMLSSIQAGLLKPGNKSLENRKYKPSDIISWAKSKDIYPPELLLELVAQRKELDNKTNYTQSQEAKVYDDEWPDKGLKPSRKDRERCRALAEYFWHVDSSLSVTDMARKSEIKLFGHGGNYGNRAVEDWIRDLHPRRISQ